MFRVELLIYHRVIVINYRTSHFLFQKGHQKGQKVFVGYDLIAVDWINSFLKIISYLDIFGHARKEKIAFNPCGGAQNHQEFCEC